MVEGVAIPHAQLRRRRWQRIVAGLARGVLHWWWVSCTGGPVGTVFCVLTSWLGSGNSYALEPETSGRCRCRIGSGRWCETVISTVWCKYLRVVQQVAGINPCGVRLVLALPTHPESAGERPVGARFFAVVQNGADTIGSYSTPSPPTRLWLVCGFGRIMGRVELWLRRWRYERILEVIGPHELHAAREVLEFMPRVRAAIPPPQLVTVLPRRRTHDETAIDDVLDEVDAVGGCRVTIVGPVREGDKP